MINIRFQVSMQLIEFSMNIADLNAKTCSNIPLGLIKDAREMFISGYELDSHSEPEVSTLLGKNDQEEYILKIGEWTPDEENVEIKNKIFCRFSEKLLEIVNPQPEPKSDEIWPLRLGILDKDQDHLSEIVSDLCKKHPLVVLKPSKLIHEAIEAAKNGESVVHDLTKEETDGSFQVKVD